MMSGLLISTVDIRCTHLPSSTVIALAGELDLSSADRLDQLLRRVHRPGTRLIIDLTNVEFMDCVGLRVLLRASQRLEPEELLLIGGMPQVRRLFEMADVQDLLGVPAERP